MEIEKKKLQEMIDEALKVRGEDAKDVKNESKEEEKEVKVEAPINDLVDKIGEKIANAIKEAKGGDGEDVEKLKSKIHDNLQDQNAVKYPSLGELKDLSDDDTIVYFFKALMNKDKDLEAMEVFKALVEGTNADGGFLVPAPLATEVWRILPDLSIMRRIGRVMQMTSQTLGLNRLTGSPVAYWTDEYATKATTSAEFAQKTLTAYKLVCRLPASHELVQDANINIIEFIIELFAEAIARAEDDAFFTGTGVGQPRGVTIETITNQSAGATLDFDDIIALIHLLPQAERGSTSAAFVGNSSTLRLLRQVKDTNGDYIWRIDGGATTSGQQKRLPDMVYGYPYYEQNDLGDELYFGNWKKYIIGDRKELTVETTNVGGTAWERDATEVKSVERVGGRMVDERAFAKLTDTY